MSETVAAFSRNLHLLAFKGKLSHISVGSDTRESDIWLRGHAMAESDIY